MRPQHQEAAVEPASEQVREVVVDASQLRVLAADASSSSSRIAHQRRGAARREVEAADQLLPPRLGGGVERLDRLVPARVLAVGLDRAPRRARGRGRSGRRAPAGTRAAPPAPPRVVGGEQRLGPAPRPRPRRAATAAARRGLASVSRRPAPARPAGRAASRPRSVSVSSRSPRKADRLRAGSGRLAHGDLLGCVAACRWRHLAARRTAARPRPGPRRVTIAP